MDLMQDLYLSDILNTIASGLLVPVVVCLLGVLLYALYGIGTFIVEAATQRRRYRAVVPELVAQVETASYDELAGIVEASGLLRDQKDDLIELVTYLWLPADGRTEVAKRLIATENDRWMKPVRRCEVVAKCAPMLGLMGTLIPLGPGLMALGEGDTSTLSTSLLVAFDTTTVGLACALVCFLLAHARKRWYRDYLVSMEVLMNAILERGAQLHEEGFAFPRGHFEYDAKGKKAVKHAASSEASSPDAAAAPDAAEAAPLPGEGAR